MKTTVTVCIGGAKTREYELQPMIKAGELRNIYAPGHPALHQSTVDAYNKFTAEINEARYHTTREALLDARHKFYINAMITDAAAPRGAK